MSQVDTAEGSSVWFSLEVCHLWELTSRLDDDNPLRKIGWGVPQTAGEVVKLEHISPFVEEGNGKDLPTRPHKMLLTMSESQFPVNVIFFHLSYPFISVPIHWGGKIPKDMVRMCFISKLFPIKCQVKFKKEGSHILVTNTRFKKEEKGGKGNNYPNN